MPTLMQYFEAIKMHSNCFDILAESDYERNEAGDLFYFAGSRSVLFKIKYKGDYYSLKCFTSPNDSLQIRFEVLNDYLKDKEVDFILTNTFIDKEITVIERNRSVKYPVLLNEWISGCVMDDKINQLCQIGDNEALFDLTDKIIKIFIKLLSLDLVHGDLKYDNIIVKNDGDIIILDWDGCYLPALRDYKTSEIGTIGFQHPLRTTEHYGCRVDDYSIVLIVITLIVLSENPSLYFNSIDKDYILLSPVDIIAGDSRVYDRLSKAWRYYPSRSKLLSFLAGDKIEMPNLKEVLTRLSGEADFNPNEEIIIDTKEGCSLRRIIHNPTSLYGFVNEKNKVIIDTMYGDATSFGNGIAGVRINADWFFVDDKGRQISDLFSSITDCREGTFVVKRDGKWGYYSAEKRDIVIEPVFCFASPFVNGRAKISYDNKAYGYINKNGEIE